jgi:hypothetical protein
MNYLSRVLFFTAASVAFCCLPVSAQNSPKPPAPPATPFARDQQAWTEVVEKNKELETKNPKAAIDAYQKFWEERQDLSPIVGAHVSSYIAHVYYHALKDEEMALKVYTWSAEKYRGTPGRIISIIHHAQLLTEMMRDEAAQTLIESNWKLALISGSDFARPMFRTYSTVLGRQYKSSLGADKIKATFRELPVYLGDEEWSAGVALYPSLIELLKQDNHVNEAFQWARLRFMLCPYTEKALTRNKVGLIELAALLNGGQPTPQAAVKPTTGSGKKAPQKFLGELPSGNANKPDPTANFQAVRPLLKTIGLPQNVVDANKIEERLATLDKSNEQKRTERITLLLLQGSFRNAMMEALLYKKELPASPNGTNQVARVLKAVDMDTKRAEAYLEFARTGKGTNPVEAFFQQYPAATESATE